MPPQKPNVLNFFSKNATEYLPKRNLAIVVNIITNILQIEYLFALSKIISPKHITHASGISNKYFCVCFSNKDIFYQLANNHNITINIRHLINPPKK